jgi:flavin reductase (DIM6/NTAB) family NADH-FMN oxidoreductase RutF
MKIAEAAFYRVIAPRTTILVTTIGHMGDVNAAPFSFVMPVSMNPPIIAFACALDRDTLDNIRANGEFVVNVPTAEMLKGLLVCSKKFPPGVNELVEANLTEIPAEQVAPPKIKEAVAWFECRKMNELPAGDHVIILGEVLAAEVDDRIVDKAGNINVLSSNVLMHVGGQVFSVPGRVVKAE